MALSPKEPSPNFEPECQFCRYLGEYEGHSLYFCPLMGGTAVTYIAKWGSGGGQYVSHTVVEDGVFDSKAEPIRVAYIRHKTLQLWGWRF